MKFLLSTILALSLPAIAAAEDQTFGDLEIIQPRVFETAATAKAGGGYVSIANNGEADDALIGAKADYPKVQIHESYEQDGVSKMRHVERITVPAGETVDLAPGGYHVMFMGLSDPFELGEKIPVTLVFEKAGEVTVNFDVVERTGEH